VTSQRLAASSKQFAWVAGATLLVAVSPAATVWWLRASGTVSSTPLSVVLGTAVSLCAAYAGCVAWEKWPRSEDLLFSELMVWGYLLRWRRQRRLASALDLVRPMSNAQRGKLDGLSTKEQAKLLERLVAGMETRDPYLHGHSRRVARHSWMIARRMGLPRSEVARIRTAAAIHDVGKIKTPKAILHKPGPLSDAEYEVIKRHPDEGALMAGLLRDARLTSTVRHHHERLDGSGYPDGLSGEAIPLGARIIAVADTFDALTSSRPYRRATPHKRAIDILKRESGTRLDAAVVQAFCGHYAGRGTIAMWSFGAGLPERVLSWLGGGVATVASAAKVAAVAGLIGGAAAASSTLGVPAAKHYPTPAQSDSARQLRSDIARSTTASTLAHLSRVSTPRGRPTRQARGAVGGPSTRRRSPTQQPVTSSPESVATRPSQLGSSSRGGPSQGTGPAEPISVELPAKGKPQETPVTGRPVEPPVKGKPVEPPVTGKPVEPPVTGKPVENPVTGKPVELPVTGKLVENPVTGKPVENPVTVKPLKLPVTGKSVELAVNGT
jgi:HD domain-containing protein